MKRKHLLLTLLLAVMVPWAAMGQTQNVFFSDDFEGSSCEWNLINGTHTNQWAWGTATNNGGTHALYISNDGGGSNAYTNSLYSIVYATRHIAFGTGEYTIAYDWKAKGESNYDYLRAWLAPENTQLTAGQLPNGQGANGISSYISTTPDGWLSLDGGGKLNLSEAWQSKSSTVNVEAGNYMLVFMWANDASVGENPPAAIDNVSIVSNCAIIPTASLPYVEDFDSYPYYSANDLPICWSYINTSTGSHTYPQMESGSSHNSSANALSLYSYSYCNENLTFLADPQPQYAILPEIQDVGRLKMTLWARARSMDNSATVTYDATFKVGVMTDPTDASTFVQIGDPITPQSTTYEQYTISFDNYTGIGTYIAIMIDAASTISDQPQASHDYHRWVCVDDITVDLNCYAPTGLAASNITFTSADLSWTGSPADESYTVRYRTAPVYGTPAFSEGFENGLDYWEFHSGNEINGLNGDEGVHAGISDYTAHSRRYSFRFSSFRPIGEGETKQQSLYSPVFSLDAPNVFSFYCRNQMSDDNGYEILRIDYRSTDETIHTLATIYPSFEWQRYSFEIPADAKQVRFEYLDGMRFVYIDDITVSKMVASYGEWQYVNDIAVTSTTLSGLTLGTEYEAQVKSDCSDEWSQAVSFATQGCTYPVPSTWDFDDDAPGTLPLCWTRLGTSSSSVYPQIQQIIYHSPYHALEFWKDKQDATNEIAVLPAFVTDLNTLRVAFYGKLQYGSAGSVNIGYVTDLTDASTFINVKTISMTREFEKYIVSFAEADAEGYIAFQVLYGAEAVAIEIDDVTVDEIPSCEEPYSLTLNSISNNGATFTWEKMATGTQVITYRYVCVEAGQNPDWTNASISLDNGNDENPPVAQVTGLNPVTEYDFYVHRECGNDDYSAAEIWRFVTTHNPVVISSSAGFTDDFESGNGWMFVNGAITNAWVYGSAAHNGAGSHALYISNDGSQGNPYPAAVDNVSIQYRSSAELSAGINWWSPEGEITLATLKQSLCSIGGMAIFNTQHDGFVCRDANGIWSGTLSDDMLLVPGTMYKIGVSYAATITYQCTLQNSVEVELAVGYNWIGYLGQATTIADAFGSGFVPTNGDMIINEDGQSATYQNGVWNGNLYSLQNGHGYVYYSNASTTRNLIW